MKFIKFLYFLLVHFISASVRFRLYFYIDVVFEIIYLY